MHQQHRQQHHLLHQGLQQRHRGIRSPSSPSPDRSSLFPKQLRHHRRNVLRRRAQQRPALTKCELRSRNKSAQYGTEPKMNYFTRINTRRRMVSKLVVSNSWKTKGLKGFDGIPICTGSVHEQCAHRATCGGDSSSSLPLMHVFRYLWVSRYNAAYTRET